MASSEPLLGWYLAGEEGISLLRKDAQHPILYPAHSLLQQKKLDQRTTYSLGTSITGHTICRSQFASITDSHTLSTTRRKPLAIYDLQNHYLFYQIDAKQLQKRLSWICRTGNYHSIEEKVVMELLFLWKILRNHRASHNEEQIKEIKNGHSLSRKRRENKNTATTQQRAISTSWEQITAAIFDKVFGFCAKPHSWPSPKKIAVTNVRKIRTQTIASKNSNSTTASKYHSNWNLRNREMKVNSFFFLLFRY